MKYKIEKVNTKSQLNKLYNNAAFTIEGVDDKYISNYAIWLENNIKFTKQIVTIYITKGHIMNKFYELPDENAYQDDCNLVSFIDVDCKSLIQDSTIKLRTFNDIVDNKSRQFIVKNVTTINQLQILYDNSALTLENIDTKHLSNFIDWLKEKTTFTSKTPTIYIIKGNIINEMYKLEGTNAYEDDLNIAAVIDIDYNPIIIERFQIGGKWFDEIIDKKRVSKYISNETSLLEKVATSKEKQYER